jgi:lactoylglutathione lyase
VRIDHIAIWTEDRERLACFYQCYFGATVGDKYTNASKGFESRFLYFNAGPSLEIMCTAAFSPVKYEAGAQRMGVKWRLELSRPSAPCASRLTVALTLSAYCFVTHLLQFVVLAN